MQCKNITKWFAVFLIVPLVFALIPAKTIQADSLNIRYENGVLSWDAVSSAAKYTVYAFDTSDHFQNFTKTTTTTSLNLSDAMNKSIKCPSGNYKIEVTAFRSNGLEITSNRISIDYTAVMPRLDNPVPRFNGKTLEWDPVENADKYSVEIQVGASKTSWYTLDKGINKTVTGTSLVIDDDFIESDLYYQATVRAVSNSNYIWSVDGKSEIVTGEQLLNGYASPVVFTGTITLNISDPKAGDKLHATLSGVPSSIPSSKITYTWAIQERIGIGAYTIPKTIQESASPDFVVPDNAATVTVFVNASGYDGYIRNDYKVTIKGWYKISDGSMFYYVDNNPVTGWKEIGFVSSGHRYYEWFYFDSNGVMQTGLVTIDGKKYIFSSNGACANGLVDLDGKTYYCTKEEGIITGWKEITYATSAGKYTYWYYFGSDGVMQTGWVQVRGTWYYMDSDGKMLNEWQKIGGYWYYLGSDGSMRKNWQLIDGVWYYFGSNGAMSTGWKQIGGVWYYFASNGSMKTGWQQIGGKWYYFKPSGAMAANEWCNGYKLNEDGTWTYQYRASWKQDSKGWWYGDSSGWYAKNTTIKIDDKNYTFDAKGYWVK